MYLERNGHTYVFSRDMKYISILTHMKRLRDYQWINFLKERMLKLQEYLV